MRLLLVPHATTDWNAAGRFQGWGDPPLNESGKQQAMLLGQRLWHETIDCCQTSDLSRARETAAAISEPKALTILPDPRLREIHFGAWEGLTYREIRRADYLAFDNWEGDPMALAPPGGETLAQLADRVAAYLASISEAGRDKDHTLLVVAHRGSLRVLICLALGLSPRSWWQFHLEPASVSELVFSPRGAVLTFLNDTHHLREAAHAG